MTEHKSLDEIGNKYNGYYLEKGKEYKGGDKTSMGFGFTKRYDALLSPIRDDPINLLELGVLNGRSLAMWSDYFPKGQIYGIDINLVRYRKYGKPELVAIGAFENDNVQAFECDVTEDNAFNKLFKETKELQDSDNNPIEFDVIIDDANHNPTPQFTNFISLFSRLKSGGVYIIEDLIKPVGVIDHFREILIGVCNKKHKNVRTSQYSKIIHNIESIEMRNYNLIFRKV
jgi:hypothetical protein